MTGIYKTINLTKSKPVVLGEGRSRKGHCTGVVKKIVKGRVAVLFYKVIEDLERDRVRM